MAALPNFEECLSPLEGSGYEFAKDDVSLENDIEAVRGRNGTSG